MRRPRALLLALLLLAPAIPARVVAHDDLPDALRALADPARAPGSAAARARAAAEWLRADGRLASADSALRVAEALEPGATDTRLARAALELDAGRAESALAALSPCFSAAGVAPPAAWWLRARARAAGGDRAGALDDYERWLAGDVRITPEAIAEIAGVALAAGDSARALLSLDAGATRLGAPWLQAHARELRAALGSRAPALAAVAAPVAVAPALAASAAAAATVTRGPYLQMMTGTRVVVRWRTDVPTASWAAAGESCGTWTHVATDPAPTTEHELALDGLTAATSYAYAVGVPDTALTTCAASLAFRTAPTPGSEVPTRVWVIGAPGFDTPLGDAVRDAWTAWSAGHPADLWLLLGDNAYGSGLDTEYQAGLFDQYPRMFATVPVWPTRGNHDILYAGPNNDYYDHFTLPAHAEAGGVPSGTEAYYAFDWANVHFICLDSEGTSAQPGSPMLAWLRADLAATTQSWVVAYWHHPPYTKGSHDSDNPGDSGGRLRDMRQYVLPILDSLGTDLVLGGHSHCYERSALLDGHYGVSSTLLPAMFVDRGDGRPGGDGVYRKPSPARGPHEGIVYAVDGSAMQISGGPLNHPVMVTSLNVGGSLVLDVAGSRLEGHFLDSQGAVLDSFVVLKGSPGAAPAPRATVLRLSAPAPQPSTGAVRLRFSLARPAAARLQILDVQGRARRTLLHAGLPAGEHDVTWDGRDDHGVPVAAGVYLAVFHAGTERQAVRLVRLDP